MAPRNSTSYAVDTISWECRRTPSLTGFAKEPSLASIGASASEVDGSTPPPASPGTAADVREPHLPVSRASTVDTSSPTKSATVHLGVVTPICRWRYDRKQTPRQDLWIQHRMAESHLRHPRLLQGFMIGEQGCTGEYLMFPQRVRETTSFSRLFLMRGFQLCTTSFVQGWASIVMDGLKKLALPSMKCFRAPSSVCVSYFCDVTVGVGGSIERDQSAPVQTAPSLSD